MENVITPPILKFVLAEYEASQLKWSIADGKYVVSTPGNKSFTFTNNSQWEIHTVKLHEEAETDKWDNRFKKLRYNGYLDAQASIAFVWDKDLVGYYQSPHGQVTEHIELDIPGGVREIIMSYKKGSPIPFSAEVCKEIFPVDVSNDIVNWNEIEVVYERDDTSGVLTEMSFPISITGEGKEIVKECFMKDGLYADLIFRILKRDDWNLDSYSIVKHMQLDFETYEESDNKIEIQGVKSELTDYINSAGRNKYDILVTDVASPTTWTYGRVKAIPNTCEYVLAEGNNYVERCGCIRPSMTAKEPQLIPGLRSFEFKSQALGMNRDDYFFKSGMQIELEIKMKFTCTMWIFFNKADYDKNNQKIPTHATIGIQSVKGANNEMVREIWSSELAQVDGPILDDLNPHVNYINKYSINLDKTLRVTINPGEKLLLINGWSYPGLNGNQLSGADVIISNFEKFKISFPLEGTKVEGLKVIEPKVLMQKYLDLMTKKPGYFQCDIQWRPVLPNDKGYKTMICAAETLRGFPDDKSYIHGSPNDFIEWMKVLGYEYEVTDRLLTFKAREKFFDQGNTSNALTLAEEDIADLVIKADDDYAYTSIKIGYKKQDYEIEYGRCEANGTFEYTTGYIAQKGHELKLESPYRADPMGIEILCQNRDQATKDDRADKDIFFVALTQAEGEDFYKEYTHLFLYDTETRTRMFNAPFSPRRLMAYNTGLWGIIAKKAEFTATDMSRNACIAWENNGNIEEIQELYDSIPVTRGHFEPVEYDFAAGHWHDLPALEKRNQLVHFTWKGKKMSGFIKKISKNYGAETETTWKLYKVNWPYDK